MSKIRYVSYALRDDPATMVLLQDGGRKFSKDIQIAVFSKKLINPEYFNQPLAMTEMGRSWEKTPNDITLQVMDNEISVADDYVAIVDSQVEFIIDARLLNNFAKEFMNSRDVSNYFDYFRNQTSGVLLFLRVYKVNQHIDKQYMKKGSKGSFRIFRLYDDFDDEIDIPISGLVPVLSDNKYMYLKDEMIHYLKVHNIFIEKYDANVKQNIEDLSSRLDVERLIVKDKFIRSYDPDSELDMTKLDYDAIFSEVLQICPAMQSIIEYIQNIPSLKVGEYNDLLTRLHKGNNFMEVSRRLFDTNLRVAVKNALYYYKRYNVELEDAFQEACHGLWLSIRKHSEDVDGFFSSYSGMWMRQTLNRYLPIYQYNFKLPAHYLSKVINVYSLIEKKLGSDWLIDDYMKMSEIIQQYTDCDEDESIRIALILLPFESLEKLLDEQGDFIQDNEDLISDIERKSVLDKVKRIVDARLTAKERNIMELRFGIGVDHEYTLSEIGSDLGLTRERIRQIENRALNKMQHSADTKNMKEICDMLS